MVMTGVQKQYFTVGESVAVLQPPFEAAPAFTGSVTSLMSKNEDLKPLMVVFNHSLFGLEPGDSVYLRPESYAAPYMGIIYQINGVKFVLVPKETVIAMVKSSLAYSPRPSAVLEKRSSESR